MPRQRGSNLELLEIRRQGRLWRQQLMMYLATTSSRTTDSSRSGVFPLVLPLSAPTRLLTWRCAGFGCPRCMRHSPHTVALSPIAARGFSLEDSSSTCTTVLPTVTCDSGLGCGACSSCASPAKLVQPLWHAVHGNRVPPVCKLHGHASPQQTTPSIFIRSRWRHHAPEMLAFGGWSSCHNDASCNASRLRMRKWMQFTGQMNK